MLATLADAPPARCESWTYELKYDGFRAVAAIVGGERGHVEPQRARSRAALSRASPRRCRRSKAKEVVLDGEVVVLDEKGAPRFQLLQQGERRERLFVFDILWLDGQDLRRQPYLERRSILEKTARSARRPAIELSRDAGDVAARRR